MLIINVKIPVINKYQRLNNSDGEKKVLRVYKCQQVYKSKDKKSGY